MIGREPLVTSDDWQLCAQTLYDEAELLDAGCYREWLAVLADEVDYRILNRVTRAREDAAEPVDPDNYHVACSRAALEARVARVETGWAFSEDPPATVRRFVSNLRIKRAGDRLEVKSNLLVFRTRWESSTLLSAVREDVWLARAEGLRLTRRWIHLDQRLVTAENLGTIL